MQRNERREALITELLNQVAALTKGGHIVAFLSDPNGARLGLCAPQLEQVIINASPTGGDLYKDGRSKKGQEKYNLTGDALAKFGRAFAIEWDPMVSGRCDDARNRDWYEYRAAGKVRLADGEFKTFVATYGVDFLVISEDIEDRLANHRETKKYAKEMKPDEWEKYAAKKHREDLRTERKHAPKKAESGAQNRVIRKLLPSELTKPQSLAFFNRQFWVVRYVQDFNDPDVRAAHIQALAGPAARLIGANLQTNPQQQPHQEPSVPEAVILPQNESQPHSHPESHQAADFMILEPGEQCQEIRKLAHRKGFDVSKQKPIDAMDNRERSQLFHHLLQQKDIQP